MHLRHPIAALTLLAAIATFAATAATQTAGASSPAPAGRSAAPSPSGASFEPGRVLVRFRPGISSAVRAAVVRTSGGADEGTIRDLDTDVLTVPAGAEQRVISALLRSGKVEFAERNALVAPADTTPSDPYFKTGSGALVGGQWEMPTIHAPSAWDMSTGSAATVIAVVDSGVAPHPDLTGRLLTGYNVLDKSTNTTDTYGHGTYVAGVIAADTDNGQGVAGTCWNCTLLPVKVYTSSSATISDLSTGIVWATDHGARVINVSMATTSRSSTLDNAVAYAANHGALVVAAAGNSGCDCVNYPAGSPGALGVAASDQSDTLYSYSDFGSWVGIDAPSGEVTTSLTDPSTGAQWGYAPVGGTSLAAPVVAGVAGLVLSVDASLTPSSLTTLLTQNVDPVAGTHQVASGRVNAYKALIAAGGVPPTSTVSPSPTSTTTTATASPSPSPSPTSSTATASTTTTFSGTLTSKSTSKTFALAMGSGATQGTLSFAKCSSMSIGLATGTGTQVAAASGPSGVAVSATVAADNYKWTASGSGRCTFTLTVTYTA